VHEICKLGREELGEMMAARSIWNGCLRVGACRIPVKLYAAAQDDAVHFHLLHDRDYVRVVQRMVHPLSGQALDAKEIHKGYEIKPGTYVLLTQAELAALDPPASREIDVLAFVPGSAIQPVWYERPYYLGTGSKSLAYFALARVLKQRGSVGVARWVMRKRRFYGAIRAIDGHLALVSLRTVEEVAVAPKLKPSTRTVDPRELALAEQLVDALAGEFDPSAFQDEHRRRVLDLITAKASGKLPKPPPRTRQRAARPLGVALAKSLEQLRKERRSA
jgi:DNA end-binding protein Ku